MAAYQEALGLHYQQVLQNFPDLKRLAFDDSSLANEQDYYLSNEGGSIECTLDEQGCVSSLFVQFHLGAPEVFDIHQQTSLSSLVQRFGPPIAKGRGGRSEVFGFIGGWVKFQAGASFVHLEFEPTQPRFKMMTLMIKNVG